MSKRLMRVKIRQSSSGGSTDSFSEMFVGYFMEVLPHRIRIEVTDLRLLLSSKKCV